MLIVRLVKWMLLFSSYRLSTYPLSFYIQIVASTHRRNATYSHDVPLLLAPSYLDA